MKILRIPENEHDALSLLKEKSFRENHYFSINYNDMKHNDKDNYYTITSKNGKTAYLRYKNGLSITRNGEKTISLKGMNEDEFGKLCNKYWGNDKRQ